MKRYVNKLIPMLLIAVMLFSMLPIGILAEEDSVVVIEDSLKTQQSLDLFEGFGCTPELKKVNGEIAGVTMGGATAANGYPFMLFGESDWEDYRLEFTAHKMDRCGAVIRSTNPVNHIDGSDGIVIAYEGKSYAASPHLFSLYSNVHPTTKQVANPITIKSGASPDVKFEANADLSGEMRFEITAKGKEIVVKVTYKDNGIDRTKTAIITADQYNKVAGRMGFRAVFKQVNGASSEGYFSDLKVTLLGDTATKYKNGGVLPPKPETTAPETAKTPVTSEAPETTAAPGTQTQAPADTAGAAQTTQPSTQVPDGSVSTVIWVAVGVAAAVAVGVVVFAVVKKKK